jgi:pilus assembly protein CpaB
MRVLRAIGSGSTLLLLAVLLGLATAGATYAYVTNQAAKATPSAAAAPSTVALRSVVIVRDAVAAGTRLPAGALELRQVPEADVLPGAYTDVKQAAGRVVRYPLVAGDQVIESRVVTDGATDAQGLAFSVPQGMRAVSVPLSEVSGAGGMIVPGDHIDVLASTSYQRLFDPGATVTDQERQAPAVLTVLQDVLVLAVGQEATSTVDTAQDPATLRPADAKPQPSARSVTLAVTPEQAQVLFMAAEQGKIGLAVRPFGDQDRAVLSPIASLQPAPGGASVNRAP